MYIMESGAPFDSDENGRAEFINSALEQVGYCCLACSCLVLEIVGVLSSCGVANVFTQPNLYVHGEEVGLEAAYSPSHVFCLSTVL